MYLCMYVCTCMYLYVYEACAVINKAGTVSIAEISF